MTHQILKGEFTKSICSWWSHHENCEKRPLLLLKIGLCWEKKDEEVRWNRRNRLAFMLGYLRCRFAEFICTTDGKTWVWNSILHVLLFNKDDKQLIPPFVWSLFAKMLHEKWVFLVCVLLPQPSSKQVRKKKLFSFPFLQSSVECLRENLYSSTPQSMTSQLEALVERTEDFTDSAYTSHEQRQAILGLCQLARQDTQQLVHAWVEAVCWCRQAQRIACIQT